MPRRSAPAIGPVAAEAVGTESTTKPRGAGVRERILDAAVTALVEGGYAGATTLRIQELAAVSRGRLLHYYPSRDRLLVAAVSHLATARVHAMSVEIRMAEPLAERADAAVEAMWSTYRQPYFWAATELWLAARANAALAEALLPSERAVQREVLAATRGLFGEELAGRIGFDALARVLNTSMRGTAIAYAFASGRDPEREPMLAEWRALARETLGLPAS